MKHRLSVRYALLGTFLGTGAPLGWLAWRMIGPAPAVTLMAELTFNLPLYLYLLLGTCGVFTASGLGTGLLTDRLIEANARLKKLAAIDALTGLQNAGQFRELLAVECARAERSGQPLSLVMADLDHFKVLNDRYGHATGDNALAHAARIIAAMVRVGDVAFRVGGEEFVVVCSGCALTEAVKVAERIRAALELTPVKVESVEIPITASLGIAAHTPGQASLDLFQAVDGALYEAKRSGRNRVCVATIF